LPHPKTGDFETGNGFILRVSWLLDGQIGLHALAAAAGYPDAAKVLRIAK